MRVLLLALGLSAVGGVLLVASCGNTPVTGDSCSIDKASLGGCQDSSGAGSITECQVNGDCAQPPDGRCGEGRCVNGKCELDIRVGPLQSQIYGDCQIMECDWDGKVVTKDDPSDAYNDGRECTVDFCDGAKRMNNPLPEGFTCPTSNKGVCYAGDCVECTDSADEVCGGPGFVCDYFWCVPFEPCDMMHCGGPCTPCGPDWSCETNEDCEDGKCVGGKCQAPTCADNLKNGDEEDVDCGGPTCGPCAADKGCVWPSDCQSDVCIAGKCQAPTCFDGKKNGSETGADCGGSCGAC